MAPGPQEDGKPAAKSPRPLYVFFHVPKCAGATLRQHVLTHLPPQRRLQPAKRRWTQRYFSTRYYEPIPPREALDEVDIVLGHYVGRDLLGAFAGRPVREMTMLRDPPGYFLSHYNHKLRAVERKGRPMEPFERWYESRPLDPIAELLFTRYFQIPAWRLRLLPFAERRERLVELFRGFWFVGSYRHCDLLLARLCGELAMPDEHENRNVSVRPPVTAESLGAAWIERMRNEHALDSMLHEAFQDRLWSPEHMTAPRELPAASRLAAVRRDVHNLVRGVARRAR